MTDNQDSSDEIQVISQKLSTATTIDNQQCSSTSYSSRSSNNSLSNNIVTSSTMMRSSAYNRDMKKRGSQDQSNRIFESEDNEPVRNLPELNVPEKIVLIIDVTKERNCTKFKLGTGATYMPMFMIKRVIEIFVGAKAMINRNHKFAIITLCQDSIKWICDFTNNVKTVLNRLDSLVDEDLNENHNYFDISQIFEILHAHVPSNKNIDFKEAPQFITRAILIYSRSNCIPKFLTGREYFDILSMNPYFILDSLFVHEPPSENNRCEEVYEELTALDAKNFSYILEVGRNATKLHDNMAKLLAHPLQRPLQKNASYNIFIPGGAGEEIQIIV